MQYVEAATRFRARPGTLYVVATPLGNLGDTTFRAVDVLGSADIVAAEDTRVSAVLLRAFGIATRPLSVHEHNEVERTSRIVAALGAGKSVALVTDAGTPAISDPGARLVRAVRDAGFDVAPIPGASAAIAAISAAGLVAERFVFLGFLPASQKACAELLSGLAPLPFALAIYEAPHRVCATVATLAEALGGERELTIARELTKTFETIARMPLGEGAVWLAGDANRERGEFVLLVDAPPRATEASSTEPSPDAVRWLQALLAELPPARAARVVAAMTGASREALYARALELKRP